MTDRDFNARDQPKRRIALYVQSQCSAQYQYDGLADRAHWNRGQSKRRIPVLQYTFSIGFAYFIKKLYGIAGKIPLNLQN